MHRRHAAVRRRFGRHGGARRAPDLRQGAAPSRRRGGVQSCRRAGPASQQHGHVHADPCGSAPRQFDRIFRHQRALDRDRRHPDRLDRHIHGRAAAALDQAMVEGRADRGSLSHHREQYPHAVGADGRHRGTACRLPARARPHGGAGRQIRHRDLRTRGRADPRSIGGGGARLHCRHAGRHLHDRDLPGQRPFGRYAGADQGEGDR